MYTRQEEEDPTEGKLDREKTKAVSRSCPVVECIFPLSSVFIYFQVKLTANQHKNAADHKRMQPEPDLTPSSQPQQVMEIRKDADAMEEDGVEVDDPGTVPYISLSIPALYSMDIY